MSSHGETWPIAGGEVSKLNETTRTSQRPRRGSDLGEETPDGDTDFLDCFLDNNHVVDYSRKDQSPPESWPVINSDCGWRDGSNGRLSRKKSDDQCHVPSKQKVHSAKVPPKRRNSSSGRQGGGDQSENLTEYYEVRQRAVPRERIREVMMRPMHYACNANCVHHHHHPPPYPCHPPYIHDPWSYMPPLCCHPHHSHTHPHSHPYQPSHMYTPMNMHPPTHPAHRHDSDDEDAAIEEILLEQQEYESQQHHTDYEQGAITKRGRAVLLRWFLDNINKPYPTRFDKKMLIEKSGLSHLQIRNYFTNMRKRHWRPIREGKAPKSSIGHLIVRKIAKGSRSAAGSRSPTSHVQEV